MIAIQLRHYLHRTTIYFLSILLVAVLFIAVMSSADASELKIRSVRLSTSQAGAPVQHLYTFNVPSTTPIGSIAFEYCTNSPLDNVACVAPAGLNLNSMTILGQTGNVGFSISPSSSANRIVLTRSASPGIITTSSYNFGNIINPVTSGETTFVRISTYGSVDGTGSYNDNGSVAFSTAELLQVNLYVPPYLTFCVGVFVTLNCNSVTGIVTDVGELEPTQTATASFQFSGATNDYTGFTTYLNGSTMTSGNNIINALGVNGGSVKGASQFGFNLRANTNPTAGLDPVGVGASVATAGYGSPNSFRFVDGEAITNSSVATDFKIFTATYIVNVPSNQSPGVYATTMTFTAVASF